MGRKKQKTPAVQKKNSIAELKPKHRFAMPLEDVKNENKAKKTSKNIAKYDIEDIAEVTEEVMKKYPFEQKTNGYKRNIDMIKKDFPKLTKEEFIANETMIMNYYDANLDYEVLQKLKKTKTPKEEIKDVDINITRRPGRDGENDMDVRLKRREIKKRNRERWCMQNPVECEKQRKEKAIKWAKQEAVKIKSRCGNSKNHYPIIYLKIPAKLLKIQQVICVLDRLWSGFLYTSRKYFTVWHSYDEVDEEGLEGGDNEIDATRHMYFQALLCNYYGGSMEARLDFAKRVGDLWEECGNNKPDSMEMDYHNNRVGREVVYKANAHYEWVEVSYWFFSVWERQLAHLDEGYLLREAGRLANDKRIIINVSEKVETEEVIIDGVKQEDHLLYKRTYKSNLRCTRSHWIRNNTWKYEYKNKPVKLR